MSNGRNIDAAIIGFYFLRYGVGSGLLVNNDNGPKARVTGRPLFDADGNFIGGGE